MCLPVTLLQGVLRAGGDISLTSTNGAITTDFATEGPPLNPIDSSATSTNGAGGNITVTAAGNVSTGALTSKGSSQGGEIRLASANGNISITADNFEAYQRALYCN